MFFKIIRNNIITEVGQMFLYWEKRNWTVLTCIPEKAHYIRTDSNNTYEVDWLRPVPDRAPRYERVNAEIITEDEYNLLKNKLENEETIPAPQEKHFEILEEIEQVPVPKTLDMSTASSMLLTLTEQYSLLLKQNKLLADCILELSQELYK